MATATLRSDPQPLASFLEPSHVLRADARGQWRGDHWGALRGGL